MEGLARTHLIRVDLSNHLISLKATLDCQYDIVLASLHACPDIPMSVLQLRDRDSCKHVPAAKRETDNECKEIYELVSLYYLDILGAADGVAFAALKAKD